MVGLLDLAHWESPMKSNTMNSNTFDVLVIGGGINGLSALYHLKRLGVKRVGLIERFSLGHEWGSSHGAARITRSVYSAPEYARLMKWVHQEEWPRLEKDVGRQLIYNYPHPGLFIGPPSERFARYIHAVKQEGADIDMIDPVDARKLYPQFTFKGVEKVLLDKTAGIISAKEVLESLASFAQKNGVIIYENTSVNEIDSTTEPLTLQTSRGPLKTERLIVAAGAWARGLFPFLNPKLTVARQTVGYFRPEGGHLDDYRPDRFPLWVYMEEEENQMFYGMPEFGCSGIKVARHLRAGVDDNPDDRPDLVESDKIQDMTHFMATFFTFSKWKLVNAEHCLYTNAPNEDFIIDFHPDNPHIVIGAGFSGHGFKFGPLTGKLLAELAWEGKVSIPDADIVKRLFALRK